MPKSEWRSYPGRRNSPLERWIEEVADHTMPAAIHFCDGSDGDLAAILEEGIRLGELSSDGQGKQVEKRDARGQAEPNPVEYISTARPVDAGPNNRWMGRPSAEMRVWPLFAGSMLGRRMYVVPYVLGPPGGYLRRVGVQITDSPYAAARLRELVRVGRVACEAMGDFNFVTRVVHSRVHRASNEPCIVHFTERQEIWSIGSDSARSALLAPTAHALRIGSYQASGEGWLAVPAAIVELAAPNEPKRFLFSVGSSAADWDRIGEGSPAGWRIQATRPHACFLYVGRDGRLWGTSAERGGTGSVIPEHEVPVSGFVFVVRRSHAVPLLREARTWRHGVYLAASIISEETFAAGQPSVLVPDPLGMLGDCGLNMGEYLQHWLAMGLQLAEQPRVFLANFDRLDREARKLWPAGAANARLLAWIHGRLIGRAEATRTAIGLLPATDAVSASGLGVSPERMERALAIDSTEWLREVDRVSGFFAQFGNRLPRALGVELKLMASSLEASIH